MNNPRTPVVLVFLFCFLLLAGIQHWSGATHAAFDGYPDEASHYLSGLMLRDYLANGFPAGPYQYAVDYYMHLPFFAVGYWPPLFYVAEGIWMTLVGYSRPDVLLLMALIAALVSATIFAVTRPVLGSLGALCCALLFLLLPDVLSNSSMVMTDTAIVVFGLWSLLALGHYFESPAWRSAILFAFFASCAIMTKYSGLYLALLPPLAVLVTRRWDVLRRASFWIQPALVVLFCGPWVLYTYRYAGNGFDAAAKHVWFPETLILNLQLWTSSLGPWISILLFGAWLYQAAFLSSATPLRRILWIQPPALVFFQSVAPVCCETRWLISGLPPLVILLAFALARLPKWYGTAVLAATVALSFFSLPHFRRPVNTIGPVVDAIIRKKDSVNQTVVYVPSDEEGPTIAEFAMRDTRRPWRVLARPNKILADMDWVAVHYKSHYQNTGDLEHYFQENPPDLVILHPHAPALEHPHEQLLQATIHQYPDLWKLVLSESGHEVYRFCGPRTTAPGGITPLFRSRMRARFETK